LLLLLLLVVVVVVVITDPISVLNIFSKILEFIVHDHLYNFFKYRLNPSQHGFRKFNSIATNLVTYVNSVIPSVSTQGQTDSVYFDVTKAFDIVPHNILLRELGNFGLYSSYVDWFYSYLSNRQSFVRISGTLSFTYPVKCGVPQSYTLSPLLFNIFINDICDFIHNSRCLLSVPSVLKISVFYWTASFTFTSTLTTYFHKV
jgi:hypothetical protein